MNAGAAVRRLLTHLIRALNAAVPKKRQAILSLYPDFESSTAVLVAGLQRQRIDVVLVLTPAADRAAAPAGVRTCVEGTLPCVWAMMRSRWVLFTHVHFAGLTIRRQRVINLWHGMPIKAIARLDGDDEPISADLTIASGSVFVPLLAEAFGVPETSVRVLPHPRLEALVSGDKRALCRLGIDPGRYRRILLWMPTYRGRSPKAGDRDADTVSTGLFISAGMLAQLSELMVRHASLLLLRRHPYDTAGNPLAAPGVRELTDADLQAARVGAYEVLAGADGLISDISSVWIDFLYCDRPTLIYFPDRQEYEADRPLLLQPFDDWSPGPVITGEGALLSEVEAVLRGEDRHADRRREVAHRLIEAQPEGSVEMILAAVEACRLAAAG